MKKTVLIQTALLAVFFVFASVNVGFAEDLKPYPVEAMPMLNNLRSCNYDAAFTAADSFFKRTVSSSKSKQNRYIAMLERGKAALADGKYDQCIADFQEAERRFLTVEGTISLKEGFGSLLTDDTTKEYEAETHEKLMISPYLVLAYLAKGDFDGARVERNRTITKINQYIEDKKESAYLENPFARLVSAIIYEMENRYDDAKIEYKKMHWEKEVSRLEEKKDPTTDLILFLDLGLAPQKRELKWGPAPVPVGKDKVVSVGFAYASFQATPSTIGTCRVALNGKPAGSSVLLYDLEKTVLAQYEMNKKDLMTKLVARMAAKAAAQAAAEAAADKATEDSAPLIRFLVRAVTRAAGAVWVAAERADLRAWLSLPRQIHYLRVNGLPPGEYTIDVDYGSGVQSQVVKIEKDKIGVAYVAIAR